MLDKTNSAVLLAGAAGVRMRPLTNYLPKAMLPIGDRPMLIRHLDRLESFGVQNITIVVDPIFGPMIERMLQIGYRGGCHIQLAVQQEHKGIGDAILCARTRLSTRTFYLILCDEYCESNALYEVATGNKLGLWHACLSIRSASSALEICATASVEVDEIHALVRQFKEKPQADQIVGKLVFAGQAIFGYELLEHLNAATTKQAYDVNGELSIGHAIQAMINQGLLVGWVAEHGRHVHLTNLTDFWQYVSAL